MSFNDKVISVKLQDLAEIQPGYQHKGQMTNDSSADWSCIQVQDLDHESRMVRAEGVWKMQSTKDLSRYVVSETDLLYLSRGSNFGAYRIQESVGKTIALAHFFILRPIANCPVLVDFLWVALNDITLASCIQGFMKGSIMPFVSKLELGQIDIPVPSREAQCHIVELAILRSQEKKLHTQLMKTKDDFYGSIINRNIYNKNMEDQS